MLDSGNLHNYSLSFVHATTCNHFSLLLCLHTKATASSHIPAGGLEPASCLPADLANTTQKDLAVLEHGMIWTGVTQFRLCHNIEYAQYTLQCMLVGCMGASFNAAQVLVGNSFWVTEGPAAGPFQACHRM